MNQRAPEFRGALPTWIGLATGVAGLGLQLWVSSMGYAAEGRNAFGAMGNFLSYYTILTNIVLLLVYASALTDWRWLQVFRHPITRGVMAANMTMVMLYVYFVLRFLSELGPMASIADALLHYAAPILYVLWWWFTQPHGTLRLAQIPVMLAPTLAYFVYVMLRGLWVFEYPYPILKANEIGYGAVALNALAMSAAFSIFCAVIIGFDMILGRRAQHG